MVISTSQVSFFESNRNNIAEKDSDPKVTEYIYTINTPDIELPCINRSYVCTYQELVSEYAKYFPEVNFTVPPEIIKFFGDRNSMVNSCLVLTAGPALVLDNANWLCHQDQNYLKKIQSKISKLVRNSLFSNDIELFVRNITPTNSEDGILKLESDEVKFINQQQNIVFKKLYTELIGNSVALYLKESLPSEYDKSIDDSSRCIKITELSSKNAQYFCILYAKTDRSMQTKITVVESRWYALFYADYFNSKSQTSYAKYSLIQIAKSSYSSSSSSSSYSSESSSYSSSKSAILEVDHTLLVSIKSQVRKNYLIERHQLIQMYKEQKITKTEFLMRLEEKKSEIIEASCNGIDLCKRSLYYCVDKGLLPLSGSREKFAMDEQNPYNDKQASMRLAVKSVVMGEGRNLVNKAAAAKGSISYWAEVLPAAAVGEVPNMTNIKQAFNTMASMKDKRKYKSIAEFSENCRKSIKNKSNSIKRKIHLLNLATTIDPFLDYLGMVHDKTVNES